MTQLGSVGSTRRIPINDKGIARTQSPTNKNYALELPTFGAIVGVSQTEVQWNGLILEEPPSWSRFTSVPGKYASLGNVKTICLLWMIRIRWKDRTFLPITFRTKEFVWKWAQKVLSLAISGGLVTASHSLALSHYWPTQGLLAAEFPPWPITPRLSQPDPPWLPKEVHIDADLSADAGSTWTDSHQGSPLQAIQQNLPPSSWITRACQSSRPYYWRKNVKQTQIVPCNWLFHAGKAISMSTATSCWKHQFSSDHWS